MIVGVDIIRRGFIKNGKPSRLKNGTYDLTIGEIFPVGAAEANIRNRSSEKQMSYSIAPQEMVWVISSEEFKMPSNVTGLATLRTTLTHQGLLALNVGIIDSHFEGKISSVIINFSSTTRTIDVDMKFFRVMFFEHAEIATPDLADKATTSLVINKKAAGEFPKNFLNIPELNDDYYGKQFGKMLWGWIKQHPVYMAMGVIVVALNLISLREEFAMVHNWFNKPAISQFSPHNAKPPSAR